MQIRTTFRRHTQQTSVSVNRNCVEYSLTGRWHPIGNRSNSLRSASQTHRLRKTNTSLCLIIFLLLLFIRMQILFDKCDADTIDHRFRDSAAYGKCECLRIYKLMQMNKSIQHDHMIADEIDITLVIASLLFSHARCNYYRWWWRRRLLTLPPHQIKMSFTWKPNADVCTENCSWKMWPICLSLRIE